MGMVLVIDDDASFANIVSVHLSALGHEVVHAGTANRGTYILQQGAVDLAIVDGLLPDMDGAKWIERTRKVHAELPIVLVSIFILLFGVVTLGLGWALFWLVSPFSIIWALFYYGLSLGGPHAATIGMSTLGIHMELLNGGRPYFLLGVAHAVAYWVSVSFLTPLIVLVGFFNRRGQLLHDLVLGTVLVNTAATMPPSRSF